jgi:glycosyltransferase involved in cell wall biosynthesis
MTPQSSPRTLADDSDHTSAVEFHSSVELASFQQALMMELETAGWKACQRFTVSQADYRNARSGIARWRLRVQTYGSYPMKLTVRFVCVKRTVGVVCTNTFFAPWLAELAAGRSGAPIVHWVFDLFPDALVLAGKIHSGSLAERILRSCVRSTLNHAAANVFLGERLRAFAEARFGSIPRSVVIPVGCDARPFRDAIPATRTEGAPVRVLYCGNLGRMHDIATFLRAAKDGLPVGIDFEFRGNGAGFREVEDAVRVARLAPRVRVSCHLPDDEWVEAMRAADVALVTMRPGAEGLVMPSKTYSALAAGQAILAVCPRASDLADTVLAHDCGWVVEPGDQAGLRQVLEEIVHDPGNLLRRRRNAWHAGQDIYDQRILAQKWITVLKLALQENRR